MVADEPVLVVRGLVKAFATYRAVDGVDLELPRGEMLGLIGANGAGKSTLLHLIYGRETADAGEIVFDGRRVGGLPAFRRARLGMALKFQVTSVFDDLTVEENLYLGALPKHQRDGDARPEVDRVLDLIELTEQRRRRAGILGHGEKQWLEIGMVLLTRPRLLLLDEPTSGMTQAESRRTADLLHQLRSTGDIEAAIVVEHDMEFIRLVSDRVVVLHRGEVLARGSIAEVQANPHVQAAYLGRLG